MKWTYLGHAMWLVNAGGLRILFDPLLHDRFSGALARVYPRRTLDPHALRPDFVIVTHRHPDHFDPPSLRLLARLDPDTVVLTSEPFIAETCRALGFLKTAVLDPFAKVRLTGGVELMTTPSHGVGDVDPEWGVILATSDGVAWNQVDTVHGGVGDVTRTLTVAGDTMLRGAARWPVALAIARWLPMREVEMAIGEATGFPLDAYSRLLDEVAAIGAHTVVPGAAGQRHAGPAGHMNRHVYPLGPGRFVRDYRARAGRLAAVAEMGAIWEVSEGRAARAGTSDLVARTEVEESPDFRPVSGFDALVDPGHPEVPEQARIETCERWVRGDLAQALGGDLGTDSRPHRLCLRVVHETVEQHFTLTRTGPEVAVEDGYDRDYDVYNEVAGSMLFDVIEGRRHWGEPLLAGLLRGVDRSYVVGADGLEATRIGVFFLYHALSYRESQERALRRYLASL